MRESTIAGALLCVALAGCGSEAVVVPYDDGHFESTALASSRQAAMREAVNKARAECQSRRRAFVASDSYTKWSGTGDEQTHRAIAAAGEIMSDAGVKGVPDVDSDGDYTAVVEFRCK